MENLIQAYKKLTVITNKATYQINKLKRAIHALKVRSRKKHK